MAIATRRLVRSSRVDSPGGWNSPGLSRRVRTCNERGLPLPCFNVRRIDVGCGPNTQPGQRCRRDTQTTGRACPSRAVLGDTRQAGWRPRPCPSRGAQMRERRACWAGHLMFISGSAQPRACDNGGARPSAGDLPGSAERQEQAVNRPRLGRLSVGGTALRPVAGGRPRPTRSGRRIASHTTPGCCRPGRELIEEALPAGLGRRGVLATETPRQAGDQHVMVLSAVANATTQVHTPALVTATASRKASSALPNPPVAGRPLGRVDGVPCRWRSSRAGRGGLDWCRGYVRHGVRARFREQITDNR